MKVLHIIDSLGLGGAQTVVRGIFEAQKDNKDIYLFALRKREITTQIDHPNVHMSNSTSKYSLAPFFALKKLVEREKIDILHCHLFRSNILGWLLKTIWFPEIKLIVHEHGGIVLEGRVYKTLMRIINPRIDIFIAISNFIKDSLILVGIPERKICRLYNCINLKDFYHPLKIQTRFTVVVGFAARLVKNKGWQEFLEASKVITKQNIGFSFVMAGDGPDREKVIEYIKKNDLKELTYLGHVSDMKNFYSKLDCFVIPSKIEPLGMSVLEAMAMEIPVIGTDVSALNEIIKDHKTGLLFEKGNSKDLAQKIEELAYNKELRQNLTINAAEFVKDFDINGYLSAIKKIYVSA